MPGAIYYPDAYTYGAFTADGTCLYVGATTNLANRIHGHRRKPWFPDVAEWRNLGTHTERRMIALHKPLHNVAPGESRPDCRCEDCYSDDDLEIVID